MARQEYLLPVPVLLMNKLFCLMVVCVLSFATMAQTPKARPLTTSPFKQVLYMTHEVTLANESSLHARVAPLTVSAGGFAADRLVTDVNYYDIGQLPIIPLPNPTIQAAAIEKANYWLSLQGNSFMNSVGRYLKAKGISSAFFSYTQEFNMTTDAGVKKKSIAWNATIDPNGRAIYGNPKIIDSDPIYIHAVYQPKAVVDGLPSNWASLYPYAGKVRYMVLNKRFEQLTTIMEIQTNGEFDADRSGNNDKVSCLMDMRYAGCAAGTIDMRTLMDKWGASGVFLDYIRQLEPVYTTDSNGDQVAQGAISYDTRILSCEKLKNSGFYGYLLTLSAERYYGEPTFPLVTYKPMQQFQAKAISPTEPFSKETDFANMKTGGVNPDQFVIDWLPNSNRLLNRKNAQDMANVIYIAPLVTDTSNSGVINAVAMFGDMALNEVAHVGAVREYYIGTIGDDYWGTGFYDRTVYFNVNSPSTAEEFAMVEEGFDDWLYVELNGHVIYVGPYGGNMLAMGGTGTPTYRSSQDGWVCRSQNVSDSGTADPTAGWTCVQYAYSGDVMSSYERWGWCSATPQGGGEDIRGYNCFRGCPVALVQYRTDATGYGNGCDYSELMKSWRFGNYVDLRPYLVTGTNVLRFKVVVGGGVAILGGPQGPGYGRGEGFIKIRTKSCESSQYGPEESPPAVPSTAGSNGVANTNQSHL